MINLVKRLGIFYTYDIEGVVDDYIIFLLQDIKKILTHLTIVCNEKLKPESQRRLEEITDDLIIKSNIESNMEAWRQILLQKDLSEYDELVLFDDSFYGPFHSFAKVFDEMDQREINSDFWGITICGQIEDIDKNFEDGYIPEHLQSYFLVIRKKMLQSQKFIDYWKKITVAKNSDATIKQHEATFTKHFSDIGYKYAAYCDTRKLEEIYDINIDHTLFNSEKLLTEFKCPILTKKVFMASRIQNLLENYSDEARRSFNYLQNYTNYDINLIWQNLLRIQNIALTKSH